MQCPVVLDGVEVRVLCRPVKFSTTNWAKLLKNANRTNINCCNKVGRKLLSKKLLYVVAQSFSNS